MYRFWVLVILFLAAANAEAASLYIDPASTTLMRSDSVTMAIRVDTDEAAGECINAADVVLSYGEAVLPVDISTGRSIFSLWIERPTINTEARTITFAGGIPNGYCGRIDGDPRLSNVLAEVVLRSPGLRIGSGGGDESATLQFTDQTTVYLHDGFGTKAPLRTFDATIRLSKEAGATIADPWREVVNADETPPREFSINLIPPDQAFGGKYAIEFNTTDKESGIDRYEVMEEPLGEGFQFRWGAADAPWIEARSPYVLSDQTLNSVIRVRATDKAGNEYVATLVPEESLRSMSAGAMELYILLASVGFLLLVIVGGGAYWFLRRRKQRDTHTLDDEADSNESNQEII